MEPLPSYVTVVFLLTVLATAGFLLYALWTAHHKRYLIYISAFFLGAWMWLEGYFGEIVSLLINTYSPLPAFVPLWAIFVGIGASALVGIVFGMYPAWKAARLDPIDALRYE